MLNGAFERATPNNAQALAYVLHRTQKDPAGHPYIRHPQRVVNNLLTIWPETDNDMLSAAWLHDVLEDCDITAGDLLQMGFSEKIVKMVLAVTKPKDDKRPYETVIDDLILTGDKGAMLIKIADNMDNLHPERVAELAAQQPEKSARLQARYRASIEKLARQVGLTKEEIFHQIARSPKLDPAPSAP